MATLQNFIDGAPAPAEGELEPVLNPATGEELARAANSTAEDVDRAVRAARRAFAGWSQTTPAERARALLALAQIVEDNGDELARSEALNAGKPLAAVQSDEIRARPAAWRAGRPASTCTATPRSRGARQWA